MDKRVLMICVALLAIVSSIAEVALCKDGQVEPTGEFANMLNKLNSELTHPERPMDGEEVERILKDYQSNRDEWGKFAYRDTTGYKRNLVFYNSKYNVMILTWPPKSRSPIHDHTGSNCFMKMLEGELVESRFDWPDKRAYSEGREMTQTDESTMSLNDVLFINDDIGLHAVKNKDDRKWAVSLHVYVPPYPKCNVFDPRNGQAVECKVNFHSEYGQVISGNEKLETNKNEDPYKAFRTRLPGQKYLGKLVKLINPSKATTGASTS